MDTRRLRSLLMIAVFYVAGPLATYSLLRSSGFSSVSALVLSGVFPVAGVIIDIIWHRRVDALGVLVLVGMVAGAVFGLVSHSTKLVLDEGSVPTAVFGLICLGSVATARPLMYRLALEFSGPDTRRGIELTDLWQYEGFRHVFRVITAVWGTAFLLEAATRVIVVQNTTAGTGLATSTVLPFGVAGALCAWTVGYGQYRKRQGERMAAEASGNHESPDAGELIQ